MELEVVEGSSLTASSGVFGGSPEPAVELWWPGTGNFIGNSRSSGPGKVSKTVYLSWPAFV